VRSGYKKTNERHQQFPFDRPISNDGSNITPALEPAVLAAFCVAEAGPAAQHGPMRWVGLSFFLLSLAQADARSAAILVDEFNAAVFNRFADFLARVLTATEFAVA
jgi:hypothetical protein